MIGVALPEDCSLGIDGHVDFGLTLGECLSCSTKDELAECGLRRLSGLREAAIYDDCPSVGTFHVVG